MYNKLFSKIIRSSVWLQPHTTRIVWLTLLATMDENGFCEYASPGNLAVTAIVTLDEAKDAIRLLESPDEESSDPDNEGRRVERVPGGWIVLNCKKYKDLVKRSDKQEATRVRVARFRSRLSVTPDVTPEKRNGNENVTTSEIEIEIETKKTLVQAPLAPEISPKKNGHDKQGEEVIRKVFAYYLRKTGKNEKIYTLTPLRLKHGLSRYSELLVRLEHDPNIVGKALCCAVDGLASSDFHMGKNQQNKKYNDWNDHLFGSRERMEKWLEQN